MAGFGCPPRAVAPLAKTETRGRVLEKGLRDATEKLATLLKNPAAIAPKRRAHLQLSLGNALQALGERESDAQRLEQAIDAYRAASRDVPASAFLSIGLERRTTSAMPLGSWESGRATPSA